MKVKNFAKVGDFIDVPDLMQLQRDSYAAFLQADVSPMKRENRGLEAILREIFPVTSYDGKTALDYICYDMGAPRYDPDECRELRLTYGAPFKIRVRLGKPEPIEEEVYLGEIPIMVGGGEFIINGAERVIVAQLHRSQGVDFAEVTSPGDRRRMHSCRIIPERGSWIELDVSKKDVLQTRIDQSGRFPATMLLRTFDEAYSTTDQILRLFYPTEMVTKRAGDWQSRLVGKYPLADIVDPETGEILCEGLTPLTEPIIGKIAASDEIKRLEVIARVDDPLILNTLREDPTERQSETPQKEGEVRTPYESALLKCYARLRPGNPPQVDKAKRLINEKFFDATRYRLGSVGRFCLNRKFNHGVSDDVMTMAKDDFLEAIKYLVGLRAGEGLLDDIDHLGNRRVRTLDELVGDELRKGFLKLRRTIQERMSLQDPETLTPRTLINSKTISSTLNFFFGRGELSQVVDQTNPLAQLTHERRLSALGPGGLNRKRAGFEVRDVHISHYGRICPIETPEGTNIGLISSLSIYARVDDFGFLTTPYRVVKKGRSTKEVRFLRADEETGHHLSPSGGIKPTHKTMARISGDFREVDGTDVSYQDVSPKQIVGVSAALIPFLEHNDANRALMGSNMQRQAVPLMTTEPPLVGTGLERTVALNSGMMVRSPVSGYVEKCDAREIVISGQRVELRKFVGLNERTCLNQKPIVRPGDRVRKGQPIADTAGTYDAELALGRNIIVAFMPWDGYNFEDAILVSESLVKKDKYTSIHIDEFDMELRETKLGREEFTRDIPNISERALRNLDETGIVRVGTKVKPGDILVGKISPKSKSELSPEEKLLRAIFGRAGEDVKNDSLEVPSGTEGIVIGTKKFSRKANLSEEDRQRNQREIRTFMKDFGDQITKEVRALISALNKSLGQRMVDPETKRSVAVQSNMTEMDVKLVLETIYAYIDNLSNRSKKEAALAILFERKQVIEALENERERRINHVVRGDELPTGVLEMVKVYVATKRTLSVGDKMAGRHGNKGVISKILPVEDMPYLEDGTPVDIVLNPLGVPSRMNVGQILETHLGWAARALGFQAISPVFDGATEAEIEEELKAAGFAPDGKTELFDGRTGEPFEQRVTVGCIYMMKLHHLVDDKIHARATGPYSLITQQPLGGKARFGGQRFGEMEVWALEAYGAASVLQELLTVKSDDVEGRTKIYESMVKGENALDPGTPMSFDVLTNEIKGLCLNMELNKKKV